MLFKLLPKVKADGDKKLKFVYPFDCSDMIKCQVLLRGVHSFSIAAPIGRHVIQSALLKHGGLKPLMGGDAFTLALCCDGADQTSNGAWNEEIIDIALHSQRDKVEWAVTCASALKLSLEAAQGVQASNKQLKQLKEISM